MADFDQILKQNKILTHTCDAEGKKFCNELNELYRLIIEPKKINKKSVISQFQVIEVAYEDLKNKVRSINVTLIDEECNKLRNEISKLNLDVSNGERKYNNKKDQYKFLKRIVKALLDKEDDLNYYKEHI